MQTENKKFSDKIREKIIALRKKLDLTQAEFAHSLGYKRQTIHAIEKGQNDPSLELIDKIEKIYSVNFEEIKGA